MRGYLLDTNLISEYNRKKDPHAGVAKWMETTPENLQYVSVITLAEIEKMAILQTLQRTNWNKQEAAQILGLYRPTLYSKMKKHEIRDAGKSARTGASVPNTSTPAAT